MRQEKRRYSGGRPEHRAGCVKKSKFSIQCGRIARGAAGASSGQPRCWLSAPRQCRLTDQPARTSLALPDSWSCSGPRLLRSSSHVDSDRTRERDRGDLVVRSDAPARGRLHRVVPISLTSNCLRSELSRGDRVLRYRTLTRWPDPPLWGAPPHRAQKSARNRVSWSTRSAFDRVRLRRRTRGERMKSAPDGLRVSREPASSSRWPARAGGKRCSCWRPLARRK